jgi:hypothetical protein
LLVVGEPLSVGRVEAVDFPQANRLTVHILAAVHDFGTHQGGVESCKGARREARGYRAGAKLTKKARMAGCASRASARAADLAPPIEAMRASGATTLRAIAGELNKRKPTTA